MEDAAREQDTELHHTMGGVTDSAGKLSISNATVKIAVAEFERDLLIDRTNAATRRAKSAGTKFGRPSALSER